MTEVLYCVKGPRAHLFEQHCYSRARSALLRLRLQSRGLCELTWRSHVEIVCRLPLPFEGSVSSLLHTSEVLSTDLLINTLFEDLRPLEPANKTFKMVSSFLPSIAREKEWFGEEE